MLLQPDWEAHSPASRAEKPEETSLKEENVVRWFYPFWVSWLPPIWGSFLKEGNISEPLAFTATRGWVEAEVGIGGLVLFSTQDLHL